MANKIMLNGTAIAESTKERLNGATVRLELSDKTGDPKKDKPGLTTTDDDGDFDFDLTDADRWPDGDYLLTVFHPETSISYGKKTFKKVAGKVPESVWVKVPDKELSHKTGVSFFTILAIVWLGLVGGYLYLHKVHPAKPIPVNKELTAVVQTAIKEVGKAKQGKPDSMPKATMGTAKAIFDKLVEDPEQTLVSDEKLKRTKDLFEQAQAAIDAGDPAELKSKLNSLDESLKHRPVPFFWLHYPWRFIELLIWALIAPMTRLGLQSGRYILNGTFYKNSVAHHIGLVLAVPFLAAIIALVLTLIKFSFKIADVGFTFDMNNVILTNVVAALIGIAPWRAWDFVIGLADRFFGELRDKFGKSEE